jgi:small subunit ribosomal protein S9
LTVAQPAQSEYIWGTGRRKTAVARVRIKRGTGRMVVNDRDLDEYFPIERWRNNARAPLKAAKMLNKFDVFASINGGGVSAQSGALVLGIARALIKVDAELQPLFKGEGYLTRDAREVERKKYGQAGARTRFQFSKR